MICTLLAVAIPGSPQTGISGIPTDGIRIRLYDYAKLPASDLARAKRGASHLLRQAGVRTVWLDCRISSQEPIKDTACEWEHTPLDLQLHILPETMTDRIQTGRYSLGRALISPGMSFFASAYYHRAKQLTRMGPADRCEVLGAIMAHEIGHLLLEKAVHSKKGLMSAHWLDADLQAIAWGTIRFDGRQTRRIVRAVRARAEMASRRLAESSPDYNSLAASGP